MRLHGLVAKPELNGKQGVCVGHNIDTGRFTVKLHDGAEFAFRDLNIDILLPRLKLDVGSSSMQGQRSTQEDRHVKIPDFHKAARALKKPIDHLERPCAFLAVYDGHCGHTCAEFAAKQFHLKLLTKLSADNRHAVWTNDRIEGALRTTCEELDADFIAKYRTAADGTTVLVALVVGERCFIAWAGDSRGVLCQNSGAGEGSFAVALTDDHRPTLESEALRVQAVGGEVVDLGEGLLRVAQAGYEERVRELIRAEQQGLGMIGKPPVAMAVSRSLGDRDFKAVTRGSDIISPTPEIRILRLDSSHRFVALVSDGITDVMSNEEIVSQLASAGDTSNGESETQGACSALLQEAIRRGSADNVSVALLRFAWSGDAAADYDDQAAKRRRVDAAAR